MSFEQAPNLGEKISMKEIINGIEIDCHWDDGYRDYVLYLPQIEMGDEATEKGVDDQVFRISDDPEDAKKVFEFAKELAKTEKDIYKVYLMSEDFARNLG